MLGLGHQAPLQSHALIKEALPSDFFTPRLESCTEGGMEASPSSHTLPDPFQELFNDTSRSFPAAEVGAFWKTKLNSFRSLPAPPTSKLHRNSPLPMHRLARRPSVDCGSRSLGSHSKRKRTTTKAAPPELVVPFAPRAIEGCSGSPLTQDCIPETICNALSLAVTYTGLFHEACTSR